MTVSHFGHSVLPDLDGHRAALGEPVPHAAEDGHLVLLELHAGAAAIAEATAREGVGDGLGGGLDPGRESFEDRGEGGAVGFPCGEPA